MQLRWCTWATVGKQKTPKNTEPVEGVIFSEKTQNFQVIVIHLRDKTHKFTRFNYLFAGKN